MYSQTFYILVGVGGAICFALLVSVIICCCRQRNRKKKSSMSEDIFGRFSKSTPATRSSSWSGDVEGASYSTGNSPLPTPNRCIEFSLPQPPTKSSMRSGYIGQLNPEIYRATSGTDGQVVMLQSTNNLIGWIEFQISLNRDTNEVTVTVVQVTNIPHRQISDWKQEKRNIFVKIFFLPDEYIHQTKVKKNTLSPVFNETFVFKFPDSSSLGERSLRFSVYDIDKRNLRHSLGHVQLQIDTIDLSRETSYRMALGKLSQVLNTQTGELELALTYLSEPGKLKVELMGCRDLPDFTPGVEDGNLFIRAQLMVGRKVIKTKETTPQKLSNSPIFDEILVFSLSGKNVDVAHLVCFIIRSTGGRRSASSGSCELTVLGRLHLGSVLHTRGSPQTHWERVLGECNRQHRMTHALDMSSDVDTGSSED